MKSFAAAVLVVLLTAPGPVGLSRGAAAAGGPLKDTMGYFVGNWSCNGGPVGQTAQATKVSYVFDLHDTATRETLESKAMGAPIYRGSYAAYDSKKKAIVSVDLDSLGRWSAQTTTGWKGNTLTWRDVANALSGRDVITRIDGSNYDVDYHASVSGTEKVVFHGHCSKTGG